MEKIKYGIIGAGTMAREHILNLSLINEAEVVALSDPHDESIKQCQELIKKEVQKRTKHNGRTDTHGQCHPHPQTCVARNGRFNR